MTTVECPKCATRLKLPPSFTGKAARCPSCKGVVTIPQPEEEVVEAVEVEEEETPVRAVRPTRLSDAAPGRKPRIAEDDDEDDDRPRKKRPATRDDDEDEEERPARRRAAVQSADDEDEDRPRKKRPARDDDEDDDDRPRKKRRKKKAESAGQSTLVLVGVGVAILALLFMLTGLGFRFKEVSYAMLVVGIIFAAIGWLWILHLAQEESHLTYIMCKWVPFYDVYFMFTRLSQTWLPCILLWGGRLFLLAAIILLLTHHFRDPGSVGILGGGGGGPVQPVNNTPAPTTDAGTEALLKKPNTAEARAWLGARNKERTFANDWDHATEVRFVNDLYARGAVRVTAAEIERDEDGEEIAHMIVVTLPAEADKRAAVLTYLNQRYPGAQHKDQGQKYVAFHP